MGIPVTSGRKVFHPEYRQFTRFGTKIRNVDNDQLPRDFRVYQGKNKMRASKPCIYYLDIVGKFEFGHLLHYGRPEAIVREEWISTPRYQDFRIQHSVTLTG